jgi:hypothetical protein
MESDDGRQYLDLVLGFFGPILAAVEDPDDATQLLIALGYLPPGAVTAFQQLSPALSQLQEVIAELSAAIEAEDSDAALATIPQLLLVAGKLFQGANAFGAAIQANFQGTPLLTDTDILADIARKLVDYLVVAFLAGYFPKVYAAFLIAGVIELEEITATPTASHAAYVKRTVKWDRLGDFLTDPVSALRGCVIDANGFRYRAFLYFLSTLGSAIGRYPTIVDPNLQFLKTFNHGRDLSALVPPPSTALVVDNEENAPFTAIRDLSSLSFPLLSDPAAGLALFVYPVLAAGAGIKYEGIGVGLRFGGELEIPLSDAFKAVVKFSATLADSLGFRVDQNGQFSFVNSVFSAGPQELLDSLQFAASVGIVPTGTTPDKKLFSAGSRDGTRFEIGSGALTIGLENQSSLRLFVEGDLRDGQIVLKASEADGFLATLLPKDGIQSSFSLGLGVSNREGLYFKGASGLSIRVPLHVSLGPINLDNLTLGIGFDTDRFPIFATTGFSAMLGPLAAAVEDMGVQAVIRLKNDRSGNFGPLDVSFGFKPPKGVGLRIDAGVVRGGGYLFLDFDNGEYAGALELTFADFLSLKAIGLITTKMPDGSQGFSLLVIITAEFSPGLQLGYGFKLIGVGGLIGLNRTVILEQLALGVRTGAVNGILFPVDPVANAPRIISDLRTIFPPLKDHFLIGPMAKLGWGTPTVVSLELGVLIEIPGNVAILGVLRLAVGGDDGATILQLQVNFIGAIEFDKKRGWFFAALFDSRIVTLTIEGEMGLLIAVGDDANFLIAVGGFHPQFDPPPLPFPSPRRIALDILNTGVARIRAEAYFAVTTNTVQLGVRAELFFGFSSCSVEGHFSFDAMLRLIPTYFIVEISAGVSFKAFGVGVFSVDLNLSLEGPTPWHARGRASVSLFFFSISASFDKTWGDSTPATLQPLAIVGMIVDELSKAVNWRAIAPDSSNLLVTLRKLELPDDALVVHPLGTLEISQNALPFNITLDRVGAQIPSDANRLELRLDGGGFVKRDDVRRPFAPAQFTDLKDSQKLSAPAFQQQVSGIVLGAEGAELRTSRAVKRSLRYELTTIDTYFRRFAQKFVILATALFGHWIKEASVTKSDLSVARTRQTRPFSDRIEMGKDEYAVVFTDNNRAAATETASFASERDAHEWLARTAANDPNLASQLQVVPVSERSAAA